MCIWTTSVQAEGLGYGALGSGRPLRAVLPKSTTTIAKLHTSTAARLRRPPLLGYFNDGKLGERRLARASPA